MKKTLRNSVLIMFAMLTVSATLSAQNNKEARVLLKGNAYMVGNENGFGLEINGKLVVAKNYRDFQTNDDAKYFAVEAKDGKYGVCDRSGNFIYKCIYYKAQITSSYIRLQTTAEAEPKFYSTAEPTTEVKAQKADPLMFDQGMKAAHEVGEKKAKAIAEQDPFAAYELKTNSKGRQELYVDGKKLFEAKLFSLISTYDFWKKSTCWFFIVKDKVPNYGNDAYGLYILSIENKDGKKVLETQLSIPYEYSYISPYKSGVTYVRCTTFSGAEKVFSWYGEPVTAETK
jgi:hypothetical protein